MKDFKLFLDLIRIKKPIGIMLLFWPCSWGLTLINDFSNGYSQYILYLTRPSIAHYTATREELDEASEKLFQMVQDGNVKVEIFKKYNLENAIQAHKDLEGRKILGPAIITP